MERVTSCPRCGAPVRLENMIRWTRLVALRQATCIRMRLLSSPDYSTQLNLVCPDCQGALSFPLDAPIVAA